MAKRRVEYGWDAESVKALWEHMGLSQQTISEWETGRYQPRRSTCKYLTLFAERASFEYPVGQEEREDR
jgi:transcriptional regulator with XRE-family HTH domain